MVLPEAHKKRIEQAMTNFYNRPDYQVKVDQYHNDCRRVAKKVARQSSGKLSEHECQVIVCHYLQHRGLYFTSVPNGAVYAGDTLSRARQSSYLKAEGLYRGFSDLIILSRCPKHPEYRFVLIEMKSLTGKPSEEQIDCIEKAKKNGGWGFVAYGDVDAIEKLKGLGW